MVDWKEAKKVGLKVGHLVVRTVEPMVQTMVAWTVGVMDWKWVDQLAAHLADCLAVPMVELWVVA